MKNVGNSSRGRCQESRKFSGHPCRPYRAHCAVIFAIAQLSCSVSRPSMSVCLSVCLTSRARVSSSHNRSLSRDIFVSPLNLSTAFNPWCIYFVEQHANVLTRVQWCIASFNFRAFSIIMFVLISGHCVIRPSAHQFVLINHHHHHYYLPMLHRARYCHGKSSVRLSVSLKYSGHTGWNNIIRT